MKRVFALVLALFILFSFASCGSNNNSTAETIAVTTEDNRIAIPDIEGTDEETAKNLLSSNGLIPKIEYEYDDEVAEGNVIRTDPNVGNKAEKNSKVTVYVSKGSSIVHSKDSRISWNNITQDGQDKWEFYSPYIKDNILYIECENVTFTREIKWKDPYKDGYIIGIASINDTFAKSVPIQAKYKKQSWKANEKQNFTLEIPLTDLNESRPTDMYLQLYTDSKDDYNNVIKVFVNFYMTW